MPEVIEKLGVEKRKEDKGEINENCLKSTTLLWKAAAQSQILLHTKRIFLVYPNVSGGC